jgi:restriction system protein
LDFGLERKIKLVSVATSKKEHVEKMKARAAVQTKKAEECLNRLKQILSDGIKSPCFNLDKLYDRRVFKEDPPDKDGFIQEANIPKEQVFWELIFPSMKEERLRKINEVERKYQWEYAQFENRKIILENEVNETNNKVNRLKREVSEGATLAIEQVAKLTLDHSDYPNEVQKRYHIQFIQDKQILAVDFELPSPAMMPVVMEYKYIQTKNQIVSKEMKQKEHNAFYDDVIIQLTLLIKKNRKLLGYGYSRSGIEKALGISIDTVEKSI